MITTRNIALFIITAFVLVLLTVIKPYANDVLEFVFGVVCGLVILYVNEAMKKKGY